MMKLKTSQVTIIAIALLLNISIMTSIIIQQKSSIIAPLHHDILYRAGPGADFFSLYHAAFNVERGISPYDNNHDDITPTWYAYRYLPALAHAATPLLLLQPYDAYTLWIVLLDTILLWLIFLLRRHMPCNRLFTTTAVILLLSSPFMLEMHMGQFTFMTVALFMAGLLQGSTAWRPVLLGLSVFIKPLTLAAMPALVLRRHLWAGLLCCVLALLLSLPIFLSDNEQWHIFHISNFNLHSGEGAGNYGNYQLATLLNQSLADAFTQQEIANAFLVFRKMLLMLTTILVLATPRTPLLLHVSTLLLAHFVSYQHAWEHHMSAVIVIGAVMLAASQHAHYQRRIIFCLVLLALPTPFYFFNRFLPADPNDLNLGWPAVALYGIVLPKILPCMILYALAAWQCVLHQRRLLSMDMAPQAT